MAIRREQLVIVSRVVFCFAVLISMMQGLTLRNRIVLHQHKDGYRSARFVVSDAVYENYPDGTVNYWLTGKIDGAEERFHPRFSSASRPRSVRDLSASYPKGAEVAVLFNQAVSDAVISNGEALRIIEASSDFWSGESRRLNRAIVGTFAPLAFAGALLFVVRRPRLNPVGSPAP